MFYFKGYKEIGEEICHTSLLNSTSSTLPPKINNRPRKEIPPPIRK